MAKTSGSGVAAGSGRRTYSLAPNRMLPPTPYIRASIGANTRRSLRGAPSGGTASDTSESLNRIGSNSLFRPFRAKHSHAIGMPLSVIRATVLVVPNKRKSRNRAPVAAP
jgi:hypothetical protein